MKKIIIPIGALLMTGMAHAQLSPTENYVYSKTYLDYDTNNVATKASETVQYFDGLGRPKQVVNIKASPTGKDVVTPIEYDGFGRQIKDYLPVPQSQTLNGAIVPTPLANVTNTPYGQEKIYSEKTLENSPLDRLLEQRQVGLAWNDKPVKFEYGTNTASEVKKYVAVTSYVNGNVSSSIGSTTTNYGANQLYKNTVTDEDGNKTIEFKNGKGQVLLVRKIVSPTENADTYYVYNEYNQLAFVIPPKASILADVNTVINDLCYIYRYDGRSRLIVKKLPGKGYEFMVYDKQDRLIMTQDAVMGANKQWLFTKYDQFGRVAYTGIYTSAQVSGTAGRAVEQTQADAAGSNNVVRTTSVGFTVEGRGAYYSNNTTSYPNSITSLLGINYYDTYPVYGFNPTFPTNILGVPVMTDNSTGNAVSTKSLPVMSLVRNIEDNNWTSNYTYYDNKGRAIGAHSVNHLGGYTRTESELDFAGITKKVITKHKRLNSDVERIIEENFTYDQQNRLLTHTHKVDSNFIEVLTKNEYNEISQLKNKKVGGYASLTGGGVTQSIDYQYNIRGWLTQINDPTNLGDKLFGYKIKYNQVEGLETPNMDYSTLKVLPKFNGNIAEVDWKTSTIPNDNIRRYGYVYDNLTRLVAGFYQKDTNPSGKEYFEKMDYDLNGNITNLKRSADLLSGDPTSKLIDNLKYDYLGNRLTKVTEQQQNSTGYPYFAAPNELGYDLNGNMTSHKDKGINEIKYNFLNLPNKYSYSYGSYSYKYRADGVKIEKESYYIVPNSSYKTIYLDGFQYNVDGSGGSCADCPRPITTLQFIPTSEGYYDFVKNKYIYNYSDHLGNVRLSYQKGTSGVEVIEENNYYPFGLKHEGYNALAGNGAYQYKYNGKELQETGMYDYGARFYMPDLGRWGVVDPLAEKSTRFSPYTYAVNNPIRFIDPDGRENKDWVKGGRDDTWHYRSDITSSDQAAKAGYTSYADGKGDDNSRYSTPLSNNGVNTGADRDVVLGKGGDYTVNGESFTARDEAPYVSSSEVDKLGKALSAQLYVPAFMLGGSSSLIGKATLSTTTQYLGTKDVNIMSVIGDTFGVYGTGEVFGGVNELSLNKLLDGKPAFRTVFDGSMSSQEAASNVGFAFASKGFGKLNGLTKAGATGLDKGVVGVNNFLIGTVMYGAAAVNATEIQKKKTK